MPDRRTPPGRHEDPDEGAKKPAAADERVPTESELDNAIADTFPASDPYSLRRESKDKRPRNESRTK